MVTWREVKPTQYFTHWAMSDVQELYFPGKERPMPNTVNYRFKNGWTDTGDLPCRQELKNTLPNRYIPCPTGPFKNVKIAANGNDLDFSKFCHRPTLITRSFKCYIKGNPGKATFRIRTCGGVRFWCEEEEVVVFEPFTRNEPKEHIFSFNLKGNRQTLFLRLEDLHERDTTCFFDLQLLDGNQVQTALPVLTNLGRIEQSIKVLNSLRTSKIHYTSDENIIITADHLFSAPTNIKIKGLQAFGRGGLTNDKMQDRCLDIQLSSKNPTSVICRANDLPAGCISIVAEIYIDGAVLSRNLGTTILKSGVELLGNWPNRQKQVLNLVSSSKGFEATVALCNAKLGKNLHRVEQILDACLITIEEKYDCADFTILPLLWLYRDHRNGLPQSLQDRLKAAFLSFRYWLDEPGNDVMWFWSENHALCFHAAQYIAGTLFFNDRFEASEKTGERHKEVAHERLNEWFDAIETDGLCEWNSAAYYPIDLLGLLSLHELAPEFKDRATKLIDQILIMSALHTQATFPAGIQGRCYEKELLAGPHTELGSVMALVLGGQYVTGYDRAAGLLAISSYQPPNNIEKLTRLKNRHSLSARYTQGYKHAGRLSLWKTNRAQLSTARPNHPGTKGHQEQILDVQLATHPLARIWINHPGEERPWGERRPSLLAGSHIVPAVAQYGPYGIVIYDLLKDWSDLKFSQLYASSAAIGKPKLVGNWIIFADEVAVWCSSKISKVDEGQFQNSLWRAFDEQMAWCVTLRLPQENVQAFNKRISILEPCFINQQFSIHTHNGTNLSLDEKGSFLMDGKVVEFEPLSITPHISWQDELFLPLDLKQL